SQRTDLPSWLIDQPTQAELPTVRPSSLAGTAEIPVTSPLKPSTSSAEWQPIQAIQPTANIKEQSLSKQITGSQKSLIRNRTSPRLSSPEWRMPEDVSKLPAQGG